MRIHLSATYKYINLCVCMYESVAVAIFIFSQVLDSLNERGKASQTSFSCHSVARHVAMLHSGFFLLNQYKQLVMIRKIRRSKATVAGFVRKFFECASENMLHVSRIKKKFHYRYIYICISII